MHANLLTTPSVFDKLKVAQGELICGGDLASTVIPDRPARDITVINADSMPKRKGLSFREGQGRLLHDLANIELQAMELCYRTLSEFPEAPEDFRAELTALLRSEAGHLSLCLQGLEDLGFQWGDWPVHPALWLAVSREDSLIDRILIVHRYLEGNGLDAGDLLLRRLNGVAPSCVHQIVGQIAREELGHVEFGSRWYRELCRQDKLDPAEDFPTRFRRLEKQIPHRIEGINFELRRRAGFSQEELQFLEERRESWTKFKNCSRATLPLKEQPQFCR